MTVVSDNSPEGVLSFPNPETYIKYVGPGATTICIVGVARRINLPANATLAIAFRNAHSRVPREQKLNNTSVLKEMMIAVHTMAYHPQNAVEIYSPEIDQCCLDALNNTNNTVNGITYRITDLDMGDLFAITIDSDSKCGRNRYYPHIMLMAIMRYLRGEFGPVMDPINPDRKRGIFSPTRPIRIYVNRPPDPPQPQGPVEHPQVHTSRSVRRRIKVESVAPLRSVYSLRSRTKWHRHNESGRLIKSPEVKYPK